MKSKRHTKRLARHNKFLASKYAESEEIYSPVSNVRHMPFGKYKNKLIKDVPTDCLNWFLGNVSLKEDTLEKNILAELKLRK